MGKIVLRVGILALLAPAAPMATSCASDAGSTVATDSEGTGATGTGTGGENSDGAATGGATAADNLSTGGTSPAPASATGGGSATATGGAGGATATDATGGAAGTEAAAGAGGCEHYPAPSEAITDFSNWTAADGTWGDETSLTGGSFTYAADNSSVTLAVEAEALGVTGTVEATEYAGFGLWFGPCTDASAYPGVTFTIGGDPGQSQVVLQLQTSQNYPIDTANNKGECEGSWSDGCASNQLVLEVAATPGTVQVLWAELSGGVPNDGVDPTELLGIQWQFNCGDAPCNVDITVDDIAFIAG